MCMLEEFFESGHIDWRLNTTLLALIPKKLNASWVSDYRPISLVSSMYKNVAKILAIRLKKCLSGLVSNTQSTFIKGRHILDGVLVANELVESRHKAQTPGILFKADFGKAYDHVNWELSAGY